jgi:hypothetical protein
MSADSQQVCEISVGREDLPRVNRRSVLAEIGYGGAPATAHVEELIDRLLCEVSRYWSAMAGFSLVKVSCDSAGRHGFTAANTFFSTGRTIAEALLGADTAALFVASAGPGIDAWATKATRGGDLLGAYGIDTIGTVIAEAAADFVGSKVAAWAADSGSKTTNRYSPGYCGWQVTEQRELFALLPPGFCGVNLTDSCMMIPRKSVSGVIGIGPGVVRKPYGCAVCTDAHCPRRAHGKHC